MAGLPGAVSATLNDKVLTFLNRARKVSLPPLSLGDVDAYYARAFEELGVCILDGERKRIVKESMGSQYLMQLLGHNVVVRATDQGQLSGSMIDAAVEAARADFGERCLRHAVGRAIGSRRSVPQRDGPGRRR